MTKSAIARQAESLNGVASKVLNVIPLADGMSISRIVSELYRTGSRLDVPIVQGCISALVASGHVREVAPGLFRRTTVASRDEPEPKAALRVVHDTTNNPGGFMPLPAHVAKEIAAAHTPDKITEREPLHDIGVLAARLRESGRALLMWAEDLERLGLEYESRVEAAGQDGKQLAQLRKILQNLGV